MFAAAVVTDNLVRNQLINSICAYISSADASNIPFTVTYDVSNAKENSTSDGIDDTGGINR